MEYHYIQNMILKKTCSPDTQQMKLFCSLKYYKTYTR